MIWSKISACIIYVVYLVLPGYCNGKISRQYPGVIAIKTMDTLYHLDQHKKDIVQIVHPDLLLQHKYKFLQIDVVQVLNPQKYPLVFYVYYQYLNNGKILLGSFSIYPPDNPGKFIVATHDKLNKEGSIILSLTTPAKIKAGDKFEVAIKRITFREK
jgi:hypothetical protein